MRGHLKPSEGASNCTLTGLVVFFLLRCKKNTTHQLLQSPLFNRIMSMDFLMLPGSRIAKVIASNSWGCIHLSVAALQQQAKGKSSRAAGRVSPVWPSEPVLSAFTVATVGLGVCWPREGLSDGARTKLWIFQSFFSNIVRISSQRTEKQGLPAWARAPPTP